MRLFMLNDVTGPRTLDGCCCCNRNSSAKSVWPESKFEARKEVTESEVLRPLVRRKSVLALSSVRWVVNLINGLTDPQDPSTRPWNPPDAIFDPLWNPTGILCSLFFSY